MDTRANSNNWETHLLRKRWYIGLLRALSLRIMMMMMMMMIYIYIYIHIYKKLWSFSLRGFFSRRTWRNTREFFVTDFALSGLENFEKWIVIAGSNFFFEAHAALLSITASVHSFMFSDLYSGKRRI